MFGPHAPLHSLYLLLKLAQADIRGPPQAHLLRDGGLPVLVPADLLIQHGFHGALQRGKVVLVVGGATQNASWEQAGCEGMQQQQTLPTLTTHMPNQHRLSMSGMLPSPPGLLSQSNPWRDPTVDQTVPRSNPAPTCTLVSTRCSGCCAALLACQL